VNGDFPPAAAAAPSAHTQRPDMEGRRQRSQRRRSSKGRMSGDENSLGLTANNNTATNNNNTAMAMQQSMHFDEGEPTQNLPHMGDGTSGKADRQSSWYTDALLQGGGVEDISSILGQVQDAAAAADDTPPDDEVLEQYRIMAHVEANIRVKDNTGFDMNEYERRRKLQPEPTKGDYYSGTKKPKPRLPEPRLIGGSGGSSVQKAEEPPLPPPRANRRFVEQRTPKVPELSPGVIVRGQTHVPEGEHVVRCLGCKTQLRVNILATLVNCPDCSTVSPASSTRH
jgi:hypothetical protein